MTSLPGAPSTSDRADSPRIYRRAPLAGLTLGLGLGAALAFAAPGAQAQLGPSADASIKPTCTIKTSTIIDKRIDIGAQYSLMRKMAGDRDSRVEASSMIEAVKLGHIAGILLPPRKAVSDRGARMSPKRGYWTMIPKGKNSICLKEPEGEAPMIIYREKLSRAQIDLALSEAWAECQLLNLPEPCEYVVDLHKPDVECKTDADCKKKKKGDFCNTDLNTCGVDFPEVVVPGFACPKPLCDASMPVTENAVCGINSAGTAIDCKAQPGERCGVCENLSKKSAVCHTKNENRHQTEIGKCTADHSPGKTLVYSAGCAATIARCAAEGPSVTCAKKLAECFVAPKPYEEFKKCVNNEHARYHKRSKQCTMM